MGDLKESIWSELKTGKTANAFRRGVQKNYINDVLASIHEAEEGKNYVGMMLGLPEENLPITVTSDLDSFLAWHLENLRQEILKALPLTTDKDTKEHWNYIAQQIKTALDHRF